jgi:hypothetical protein
MDQSVAVVRAAIAEGIPIHGYTWWPLFDMIEWDYRLEAGPLYRYNMPSGLWANRFDNPGTPITYAVERGDWAPRFGGADSITRERTPLADHFLSYTAGER